MEAFCFSSMQKTGPWGACLGGALFADGLLSSVMWPSLTASIQSCPCPRAGAPYLYEQPTCGRALSSSPHRVLKMPQCGSAEKSPALHREHARTPPRDATSPQSPEHVRRFRRCRQGTENEQQRMSRWADGRARLVRLTRSVRLAGGVDPRRICDHCQTRETRPGAGGVDAACAW